MSELWCHFDYTSTGETMFAEDCIASMLERIEQSFRDEGLMIAAPERLPNPRYAAQRSPCTADSHGDA